MVDGVSLALYVGKGKIGNWVIRKWTGSQESHCELVVDGLAYSSSIHRRPSFFNGSSLPILYKSPFHIFDPTFQFLWIDR